MDASSKSPNARQDRTLRIITIIAMVPALALGVPSIVVSHKALPGLGLLPMGLSCMVSLTALGSKKPDSAIRFVIPGADIVTATLLMVLMIASWINMAEDWSLEAKDAILCSYALTPLMLNFCIHTYLVLRSPSSLFQTRPCPNCNHVPSSVLPRWQRSVALPAESAPTIYRYHISPQSQPQPQPQPQQQVSGPGHSRSSKEIYQPPMRAYGYDDADAEERPSSEFQTSGFNTPRQSVETLGSEDRESSEGTVREVTRGKSSVSLV